MITILIKQLECGQRVFGENRVQEAFLRWQKRIKNIMNLELKTNWTTSN